MTKTIINLTNIKEATCITRYNYETKQSDIYSVWLSVKHMPGVSDEMVDDLTQAQAYYVCDAVNAAIKSGATFNLAHCLRRYDAGV